MPIRTKMYPLLSFLCSMLLLYFVVAYAYLKFSPLVNANSATETIRFYPNESSISLITALEDKYNLNYTFPLRVYLRLSGVGRKLQVGEYSTVVLFWLAGQTH